MKLIKLFCEEKSFQVDIRKLYSPLWKVQETMKDVDEGRTSRNLGIIKVSKMGGGKYFIIDGNHRVVEAIQSGSPRIEVTLDQYTPDMSRTGGAYDSMLSSAVQVVGVVQGTLKEETNVETIYRGESTANKGGVYWTNDIEYARQFTQSGRYEEIIVATIPKGAIYDAYPLPRAYVEEEVDKGLEEARKGNYKAMRLSEGSGEPNSIWVFDKSAIKVVGRGKEPKDMV